MPWWGYLLTSVGGAVFLAFWGWVAVNIIALCVHQKLNDQHAEHLDDRLDDHATMFGRIEGKLDKLAADVARLFGLLNGRDSGG